MGLLDGFLGGGDPVQAPAVNVSPQDDAGISDFVNNQRKSQGELASGINAGTNAGMNTDAMSRQNQVMYGVEPGMSKAIQTRYQSLLDKNNTNTQNQGNLNAYGMKLHQLQQAQNVMNIRQSINTENFKRQMDAYAQNQKARAQAIGAVFGLAGTVAGAAFGGPAGAVIGGSVGQSMGEKFTSNGGNTSEDYNTNEMGA